MTDIRVAVAGAAGRMGRALLGAAAELDGLVCSAALEHPGHAALGMDSGLMAGCGANGIDLRDDPEACASASDVWIEFTGPEPTLAHLESCVRQKTAAVIGTTGLDDAGKAAIAKASEQIPIVFAPNMSVGVNATMKLIEMATQILGDDADIEIIEAHHRHKVDAPSGTAVRMGEIVAETLGRDLREHAIYGREGQTGPRARSAIGFETIRGGDIVGEHTVMFAIDGERLEITHRSHTRANFAYGAMRAARWVVGQDTGLFSMNDVLGLA